MNSDQVEQAEPQKTAHAILLDRTQEFFRDVGQWQFPPEFRIARPPEVMGGANTTRSAGPVESGERVSNQEHEQNRPLDRSLAEIAVCLWDIQRKLQTSEIAQQDRKLRLLNRRAEKAIAALGELGVVIDDPIGRRYAAGSEGSMKPNFQPTPGTTYEKVVETITPVIYRQERLIGRGEVFVAVPLPADQGAETAAPAVTSPDLAGPEQIPFTTEAPEQYPLSAATEGERESLGGTAPNIPAATDDEGLPDKPEVDLHAT